MANKLGAFESQELLQAAFRVIDPDGKGLITHKMLKKVVREFDLDFTDEEIRDMIDEADPTGEGHVNVNSVHTMFVETHLALSEEAKKRWKQYKNRVPLPKYKKRLIVEKVKVKKLPGKKLTKQEAQNINRFNKLSLLKPPEKSQQVKKPGAVLREKRELELIKEKANKRQPPEQDKVTKRQPPEQDKVTKRQPPEQDKVTKRQPPEQNKVIKKPGAVVPERKELQLKKEKVPVEKPPERTKVVKQAGVALRERRESEPVKEKVPDTKLPEKTKVVKKPGVSLREKRESEIESEKETKPISKTKVIKKPGVSLRERRALELELERASGDEDDDESENNRKRYTRNIRVISRNTKSYANKHNKSNNRDTDITDTETIQEEMSQRSLQQNGGDGYYGDDDAGYDGGSGYDGDGYDYNQPPQQQHDTNSLPPIEKHNGVSSPQHSPTTSKKVPVYERLYDPDYRKNRSIPTEPEPIYVREFKSRPPKKLEHVKSKHMDKSYFEPRGEYILETDEESQSPQFRAKPPRGMEHIESRHMNPEYQKKRQSSDESAGEEQYVPQFQARVPRGMEHVQSKILDPRYFQEKPQPEEEYYDTEFRARPPKKLETVQSRIMDPRYFQEKQVPEEERYDTEFKARLPKKLEHVQSRLLDAPKKPKQSYEEADTISLPSFRAKPPRHLNQVSSRILDPHYFEPKPESTHEDEDKYDHNFKARIPKGMEHVESRALDPKYFKKKIPPITSEDREVQNINHNFKSSPPKHMAHVQSRFFDPAYNRQLSPRSGSPVVELKQRGGVVVINVKKDPERSVNRRSKSQGYKEKLVTPRGGHYYTGNQLRQEGGSKSGLGLVQPEEAKTLSASEKKEPKRWRPPRKPKLDKIDKEFFDSWVVSPTHIYQDSGDMFYNNRRNVSEMWTSLARSIKKTVIENGDRIRPVERTYY